MLFTVGPRLTGVDHGSSVVPRVETQMSWLPMPPTRPVISVSLGGRVDGIPYHDLIGKSDGFRRPGYIVFLDPAVALERGANSFTVSTPIRVFARLASANLLKGPGGSIGSGDLAGVLMFFGYARRF